jgi:large subunit ribosomal protein L6
MVQGVTEGFTKQLEMAGVGHRASMQGNKLQLSVGFSHPVLIAPPANISFAVAENTKISVSGIDKEVVGQVAAEIRGVKPPEPYKGKGIHYQGEVIRRKAGKAAKVGGK